ncbi:NAD(P)/FAD-dependent oxidoreductase [Acidithiobacillus montserratensis]|uniref:NAD(P)/FAD-dependent oxidoreductase n=1 Tax=Acidithiobacillus montserratensis TaxID=2729135 RepID=A0ACD5HFB6_9PROT|nr:NAD(P)/FAD-dependent oxidoreductase [Acidithiobacillus montserratensis]MBN2680319.1 NAD(P)/FAD-dependent oxidoreductase [Acidithiobacillaceae bacterium]MBU2748787.1 NAD(P)/FAD-dependent oxidoreductase [Acidithiobacillus montserratensis]
MRQNPEKIVIIGAGFGGLQVAKDLAQSGHQIIIIDCHNYHLFQPLLYQVAAGDLESNAIATPLRPLLRSSNIHFHWGCVKTIDWNEKKLYCADHTEIHWDKLILSFGTVTNFFGNKEISENALHLKTIAAAEQVQSKIIAALEKASASTSEVEQQALLHFVIAGGGPTGVEFCGALLELLRIIIPRDYPELPHDISQVTLIQGGDALLPGFAEKLQKKAYAKLQHLGAHIILGKHVDGFDGQTVRIGEQQISASTLIWTAGVTAHPLIHQIPGKKMPHGRIPVDGHCRLIDHAHVYAIGDLAYGENHGTVWPQVAPFAVQSAKHVAKHILSGGKSADLPEFTYKNQGSMAVLKAFDGVCEIPRYHLQIAGLTAWLLWLFIHLYGIIGGRNKILALMDWGVDYIRHSAAITLIREDKSPY